MRCKLGSIRNDPVEDTIAALLESPLDITFITWPTADSSKVGSTLRTMNRDIGHSTSTTFFTHDSVEVLRTINPVTDTIAGTANIEQSDARAPKSELFERGKNDDNNMSAAVAETTSENSIKKFHDREALERHDSQISIKCEKFNDSTDISAHIKSATWDSNSSNVNSLMKAKKRAIDELEEEARKEISSSPRNKFTCVHEFSDTDKIARAQAENSDVTVSADKSTPTPPIAGSSKFQADASTAASSTVVLSGVFPSLLAYIDIAATSLRCTICVAKSNGARVRTYKRRAELNRHMNQKHITGKVPCSHCKVPLANKYAVNRHIASGACHVLGSEA